ncbi:uncharacterized protein LAJ45_10491 [Morchella importuna]|uniref:uncharacterized protein n=1 Tax=Morchella importuna TaxID=1174673 RepID=UPI001E8D3D0F|nr:uncharacterized protein LAJ45_10491 [Morchella importuna]KAH8145521.1 hypothetical protein LAJ45_10491 [Morchella importuna]
MSVDESICGSALFSVSAADDVDVPIEILVEYLFQVVPISDLQFFPLSFLLQHIAGMKGPRERKKEKKNSFIMTRLPCTFLKTEGKKKCDYAHIVLKGEKQSFETENG